jgi:hypothetical protein
VTVLDLARGHEKDEQAHLGTDWRVACFSFRMARGVKSSQTDSWVSAKLVVAALISPIVRRKRPLIVGRSMIARRYKYALGMCPDRFHNATSICKCDEAGQFRENVGV